MLFDLFFITTIIGSTVQAIKERIEPVMTMEDYANKELYDKDIINGVPMEQITKNLRNGKYRISEKRVEPHRDTDGKIIIENCKLYDEDLFNYGAVQTMKWVEQGKYNLDGEELRKEEERIKKHLDYLCSL